MAQNSPDGSTSTDENPSVSRVTSLVLSLVINPVLEFKTHFDPRVLGQLILQPLVVFFRLLKGEAGQNLKEFGFSVNVHTVSTQCAFVDISLFFKHGGVISGNCVFVFVFLSPVPFSQA